MPPASPRKRETQAMQAKGKGVSRSNGFVDLDHRAEDRVPGFLLLERLVREHAAVPTDVLDAALVGVLEPVGRGFRDIEFAVRIIGRAMTAGLVVRSGAVDGAVVLS